MKIEHILLQKAISLTEINHFIPFLKKQYKEDQNCYIYVSYKYSSLDNDDVVSICSIIFEKNEDEKSAVEEYLNNVYDRPDYEENSLDYLDEIKIVEQFYQDNFENKDNLEDEE